MDYCSRGRAHLFKQMMQRTRKRKQKRLTPYRRHRITELTIHYRRHRITELTIHYRRRRITELIIHYRQRRITELIIHYRRRRITELTIHYRRRRITELTIHYRRRRIIRYPREQLSHQKTRFAIHYRQHRSVLSKQGWILWLSCGQIINIHVVNNFLSGNLKSIKKSLCKETLFFITPHGTSHHLPMHFSPYTVTDEQHNRLNGSSSSKFIPAKQRSDFLQISRKQ